MKAKKLLIGVLVGLLLGGGIVFAKWSDYGLLSSGNIVDGDDFLVRDVSDTSLAATGTQKRYSWASVKTDLGSAGFYENADDLTIGSTGDPADTGTINLVNTGSIASEASPTGTDVVMILTDSSEVVQIAPSGASGVTITPALTGTTGTFTGILSGELGITVDTTATIDLSTAANARGAMRINGDNDVIDYTLPPAKAGLNVCFYSQFAQVVTIDPDDTADTITLDGVALTAGYAIDSPGTVGDFICLMCIDATNWITLGRSGTWVDGGTD